MYTGDAVRRDHYGLKLLVPAVIGKGGTGASSEVGSDILKFSFPSNAGTDSANCSMVSPVSAPFGGRFNPKSRQRRKRK
jgi:hypothetical protein